MQVDPEVLAKFKELYEKEFKEKITDQEAYNRFMRLVEVLRILRRTRPPTSPDAPAATPPQRKF